MQKNMRKRGNKEMTSKLLKYDIRSEFRTMWMFWAAAPVIGLIVCFVKWGYSRLQLFDVPVQFVGELARGLSIVAFIACMVALTVFTIVVVITRFYKGLIGQEGYLMHTLPAKPWQLITSRGIAAFITIVISSIVALISFGCLDGFSLFKDMAELIGSLFDAFNKEPRYIFVAFEVLIIMAVSVLKTVYKFYASMSVGQLFDKHRVLCSLLAFVLISIVLSVIGVFGLSGIDSLSADFEVTIDDFQEINILAGIMLFIELAQAALFYVITERIISKKLNLL